MSLLSCKFLLNILEFLLFFYLHLSIYSPK
nr:MAG TPA: hypothetical protein [Caudoviricetes sp.]DAX92505.1 MAG TPA: hypothetical protein [Caudoviricetes sp.]